MKFSLWLLRDFYRTWRSEIKGAGAALAFFGVIVALVTFVSWTSPVPKQPYCPRGTVYVSASVICVPGVSPVWK